MPNSLHYILDGHEPKEASLMEWATWLENKDTKRHVAENQIGIAWVSTVFLGLDHQWGDGPPLLFETMVFCGANDGDMTRASTWDEAEQQHYEMVKKVVATPWYKDVWWVITEAIGGFRRNARYKWRKVRKGIKDATGY